MWMQVKGRSRGIRWCSNKPYFTAIFDLLVFIVTSSMTVNTKCLPVLLLYNVINIWYKIKHACLDTNSCTWNNKWNGHGGQIYLAHFVHPNPLLKILDPPLQVGAPNSSWMQSLRCVSIRVLQIYTGRIHIDPYMKPISKLSYLNPIFESRIYCKWVVISSGAVSRAFRASQGKCVSVNTFPSLFPILINHVKWHMSKNLMCMWCNYWTAVIIPEVDQRRALTNCKIVRALLWLRFVAHSSVKLR